MAATPSCRQHDGHRTANQQQFELSQALTHIDRLEENHREVVVALKEEIQDLKLSLCFEERQRVRCEGELRAQKAEARRRDAKIRAQAEQIRRLSGVAVVPDAFLCPITTRLMRDPVVLLETGHTFERAAIEKWLRDADTDPLTNTRVVGKRTQKNFALAAAIDALFPLV
jgi:hypothetical protein